MLLVVLLALHVQIGIHELGHLLAVYACRYRPRRIGVGFLEFGPARSRWRVRATREWRFFLGGVVMFTVPDHIRSWSRDVLCYSAGLFASLLVLVALALLSAHGEYSPETERFIELNLNFAAYNVLFNALPLRGARTDGYALMQLWQIR